MKPRHAKRSLSGFAALCFLLAQTAPLARGEGDPHRHGPDEAAHEAGEKQGGHEAEHDHDEEHGHEGHRHEDAKTEQAHAGHSHGEHEHEGHEAEESGVTFKEGRGLSLSPEVVGALGVKTVPADRRTLSARLTVRAHVFSLSPRPLAFASVSSDEASFCEGATVAEARLLRVDRSTEKATGSVDIVFELPASPARAQGEELSLALERSPREGLAVPATALLETAAGTFVYVLKDGFYLRTEVSPDMRAEGFVSIARGLAPGAVVVTAPVEQLWLAELRLTKGGGHSH